LDLPKLALDRDRLLKSLQTKGAVLYIVKGEPHPKGLGKPEFTCPLCWHDNESSSRQRKCERCGALLKESPLQQLRSLVAENREAVLRLMMVDRHQFFVEPRSAMEYLSSPDISQMITGLMGLYAEARFADRDTLAKQSLGNLLSCVRESVLELCEDQARQHEALETLFFHERWDLLYYIASSSTESTTRAMAIDRLASLRVTDCYHSAHAALKVVASDCIYGDTREVALSKYKKGIADYGSREDPDLADWLRRTRWS
jgi:hypothetical protein